MQLLRGARLKIDRANQHIRDVETLVDLLKDRHTAVTEKDGQGREKSIRYGAPNCADSFDALSLVVGDAIHNLRTALDHAWVEVCKRRTIGDPDHSKFPFRTELDGLKKALDGIKVNATSNADLYALITSEIRPYKGGDDALYALHDLDIRDKHTILIDAVGYIGLSDIEFQNDTTGEIHGGHSLGITGTGPYFIDAPANCHVKKKGEIGVDIIFEHGLPLEYSQILGSLQMLSNLALRIVQLLEDF